MEDLLTQLRTAEAGRAAAEARASAAEARADAAEARADAAEAELAKVVEQLRHAREQLVRAVMALDAKADALLGVREDVGDDPALARYAPLLLLATPCATDLGRGLALRVRAQKVRDCLRDVDATLARH